jgi:large exoprotein involved in heme utilization and adhesion
LPSALGANAQGKNLDAGDAGTVLVEARNVTIANGGQLSSSTSGPGRGGTIQITAQETVSLTGENPDGQIPSGLFASSLSREQDAGPAGQIEVTAAEFSLTQGGSIFSRTAGPGAGGTVDATISGGLTLSGQRTKILTDTEGTGAGGSIQLSAAQINLKDQARLSSASSGLGNAGDILLTARQSFESDQSTVQTSADLGVGGDIHIIAGESARLVNNSLVSATSAGQGDAGSVTIDGGTLIRGIDSTITGEAQQASGGNVTLIADDLIHLTRTNVTASVQGGPQSIGGNILFDPQIILLQNSKVVAQANQGAGGTITLVAGTVLADPSSLISASSQSGPQGTVTIQSPLQNLSGALVPLQQGFLPVTTLNAERCAARMSEGKVSTFVVTLREGLPPEPGGPLPSPLEDIDLAAAELPESLRLLASSADPVSPATGRDLNRTGSFNHACRR